ncbi:MAG TPA: hypothetical protein VMZ74_13635 [Ramlibacter sp.]|nr:hypothetical protein [Ramlibacter sp.]
MKGPGMKALIVAAALAMTACATSGGKQVLGTKPAYLASVAETVPNQDAIGPRIFIPGLDEDWVPQGLVVIGDHILVSSYKPTPNLEASAGPCRVYRVERETGIPAGRFDVPLENCNSHAGGMAHWTRGQLLLADTQMLSLIDYEKAFATGTARDAIRTVKIEGGLRGSLAGNQGGESWIGTWSKEQAKSLMYRMPRDLFERRGTVREDIAAETRPIPVEAQGAAFDRDGNLWVSASRSNTMSKLYRLDRAGTVTAEYEMPIGIEGIGFDSRGKLWAITESGTRKYLRWGERFNFPFIFEIDTTRLK